MLLLDFKRASVFCLGHRLSKHKMTRYARNFFGSHGPLGPYGCPFAQNPTTVSDISQRLLRFFAGRKGVTHTSSGNQLFRLLLKKDSNLPAGQVWIWIKIKTSKKYQSPNLALGLVKTNGCQPQAKCLAKTFETLIKSIDMILCAAEHPHPTFFVRLLQNLMLDDLHFSPTAGYLRYCEWIQLSLERCFSIL